eukprot:gene2342-4547_t
MNVRQRPRQASYASKFDIKGQSKAEDDHGRINVKSEGQEKGMNSPRTQSRIISRDDAEPSMKGTYHVASSNVKKLGRNQRTREAPVERKQRNISQQSSEETTGGKMIQYLRIEDIPDADFDSPKMSPWGQGNINSQDSKQANVKSIIHGDRGQDMDMAMYQKSSPPPLPVETSFTSKTQVQIPSSQQRSKTFICGVNEMRPMPTDEDNTNIDEDEEEEYEQRQFMGRNANINIEHANITNYDRPNQLVLPEKGRDLAQGSGIERDGGIVSRKAAPVIRKQTTSSSNSNIVSYNGRKGVVSEDDWSDDEDDSELDPRGGYFSPIEDVKTAKSPTKPSSARRSNNITNTTMTANNSNNNNSNRIVREMGSVAVAAKSGSVSIRSTSRGRNSSDPKADGLPKNKDSYMKDENLSTYKLPPLPADQRLIQKEVQLTEEEDGAYVSVSFGRNPRPTAFRPYTLEDYQRIKPQSYVEMGKLKPDLNSEELVAKRANAQRIKEFSKNLKSFNEQSLQQQRRLPPSSEAVSVTLTKKKEESSRGKALSFAKNIPKPKIPKTNSSPSRTPSGREDEGSDSLDAAVYEEQSKLLELQARHVDSKRQVEAIKKSLGL